jgi:hypothetical protein
MEYMFYVPIFHYKVNDWDNKKKNLLEFWDLEKENCTEEDLVRHNFDKDNSELDVLVQNTFFEEVSRFLNEIGRSECEFLGSWFENSMQNGYHGIHNHGPLGYSAVCYLKYDETVHTPTKFYSPFNSFITGSVLEYVPENATEGSILFFPSNIPHCTEPNTSEIERLVVSFNVAIEKVTMPL